MLHAPSAIAAAMPSAPYQWLSRKAAAIARSMPFSAAASGVIVSSRAKNAGDKAFTNTCAGSASVSHISARAVAVVSAAVKALSPAFFAREDTLTPLIATLKGVVLAIAAAFLLGHWFGADGIAAAIALGAWSIAFSLIRRGAERFGFSIDADAKRRLPRIVMAALAMGALLWLATGFLPALASGAHSLEQAVALFIVIGAGIAIYGLFLRLFGVTGWREAVNAVRQSGPS